MTVQLQLQLQPQLHQQQLVTTLKAKDTTMTNSGTNSDLLTKNNSFNSVTDILQIEQQQQQEEQHQRDATSSKVEVSSSSSISNETTKRRGVQFGVVEVRLYNRIVGDHPDVKVGPPITFSWEYNTVPTYETIDRYEQEKANAIMASQTSTTPYRIQQYTGVRKLSSITRKNMLRNVFDVSEEEIIAAEKEVQKIQASRGRSIQQSQFTSSVESNIHKFRRKVRQGLRATLSSIASIPLIVPGVVPQI